MAYEDVLAVILGGGRGTRLWPLTKFRAKPAVPIAGKYRLIDIPVSNCLNSGVHQISILTQFNSVSFHCWVRVSTPPISISRRPAPRPGCWRTASSRRPATTSSRGRGCGW